MKNPCPPCTISTAVMNTAPTPAAAARVAKPAINASAPQRFSDDRRESLIEAWIERDY